MAGKGSNFRDFRGWSPKYKNDSIVWCINLTHGMVMIDNPWRLNPTKISCYGTVFKIKLYAYKAYSWFCTWHLTIALPVLYWVVPPPPPVGVAPWGSSRLTRHLSSLRVGVATSSLVTQHCGPYLDTTSMLPEEWLYLVKKWEFQRMLRY